MDDRTVFTHLLSTLRDSPMWAWGSPPCLWAVVSDDPVIILPAFMIDSVESLHGLADHWRTEHLGEVPAQALALTTESEAGGVMVRDCVVTHKDGVMFWVRHINNGSIMPVPVTGSDGPMVEVMREVGASAWP